MTIGNLPIEKFGRGPYESCCDSKPHDLVALSTISQSLIYLALALRIYCGRLVLLDVSVHSHPQPARICGILHGPYAANGRVDRQKYSCERKE